MPVDDITHPWLSIIGLGEDGVTGLSPAAVSLIKTAHLVIGGQRHLDLLGSISKSTMTWPSPLKDVAPDLEKHRGKPVVVLASGDPFCHGVGTTLVRLLKLQPHDYASLPQPSAFSLVANKLGWAQQDAVVLGLNNRPVEILRPHLTTGRHIICLSKDHTTPANVARILIDNGCATSRVAVLSAIGGPRETTWSGLAAEVSEQQFDNLNTVGIEVVCSADARQIPSTPGLPDDWFEHDGQLTKREIRAITLSSLAPKPGQHLWDIGCGAGSIGIEWMLSHPACRATGIERDEKRATRAAHNALQLGTPQLSIVTGEANDSLARLAQPDSVFFGGGAKDSHLIDQAWDALPQHGRLVANAVTLETQAVLQEQFSQRGGDLVRINIERAEPVGTMTGWRPAMPVMQWVGVKS